MAAVGDVWESKQAGAVGQRGGAQDRPGGHRVLDDLEGLIRTVGYAGMFVIIAAESGLPVGLVLPGASLLLTAGVLAAQGLLHPALVVVVCVPAAITGNILGYALGQRVGRRLLRGRETRWLKRRYLRATESFYERHGGKAVFLGRFVPYVRTLMPIVAGVGAMPYRRFMLFTGAGAVVWGTGMITTGYLLGRTVPDIDRYLLPLIFLITTVVAAPSLIRLAVARRTQDGPDSG